MSKRKQISQRIAHASIKRVRELESVLQQQQQQRNAWAREWPGGVHIGTITIDGAAVPAAIKTARKLSHAVVVTVDSDERTLIFYALPNQRDSR